MTREELREEVAKIALGNWVIPGPDWVCDSVMALIDRYEREREQWQSEPPTERQETMLMEVCELGVRHLDLWYGYDPGEHWPPHQRYTGRWRKVELPPEEEPKP